jgi:anhydro-N-acetylmuramic acid kinase
MLEDPYFKQSPPKSTGREYFHLRWLQHHLDAFPSLSAESVQATLTELTAVSVAQAIRETLPSAQIYVAGGGSANQFLMERLRAHLPEANYPFTKHLSVDPDAIEALLMAYLAYCHVQGLPGNIPGVTGAHQALILGGYYHAK